MNGAVGGGRLVRADAGDPEASVTKHGVLFTIF